MRLGRWPRARKRAEKRPPAGGRRAAAEPPRMGRGMRLPGGFRAPRGGHEWSGFCRHQEREVTRRDCRLCELWAVWRRGEVAMCRDE